MNPKSLVPRTPPPRPPDAGEEERREAILSAEALQTAILNSANFSSIATDAKGVIQLFNVGAERMLGYTAEEVVNTVTPTDLSDPAELLVRAKTLSDEFHRAIAPGFHALVFKAIRGIEDIHEVTYIRKDGSRLAAEVSVTALRDPAGTIIGYLLVGTDNTARKAVEAERRQLAAALQEKMVELETAKQAAEKANLAKSDFLSSMSHELRSPLNAIIGFAQLMQSEVPPPNDEQRDGLNHILHAGWHLLTLINEILDLAKIESGGFSLSVEAVSLGDVMAECQGILDGQARKLGISVRFPTFAVARYVRADRTRLKQVLINLISNGIKYNRPNGTVNVSVAEPTPGTIRVNINDTGAGLSPGRLAQLFQPFNRLGQESGGVEGTGIGLVVAKQLVERMHGVMGVESRVEVGSDFWFELAAEGVPDSSIGAELAPLPPSNEVAAGGRQRRFLYVEDNPANLKLVERLVTRRPEWTLTSAITGRRGVELAHAQPPEVILMDINLPDISGIDALQMLKRSAATAHIPVIAVTASAMPHGIEKGLEAGFFKYVTKPIDVNVFMETLASALAYVDEQPKRTGPRERRE